MDTSNFPYKTLIIAVAILIGLYIFKTPVADLIFRSNEIDILGVKVKVNESTMESISKAKDSLNGIIEEQSKQLERVAVKRDSLHQQIIAWKDAVDDCNKANALTFKIEKDFKDISAINKDLIGTNKNLTKAIQIGTPVKM